jgi:hypothetical protein
MLDLEEQAGKVWNPDIRPLIAEAYRCYTTGAARACITLTWVAVCADLIEKVSRLAEEGEGAAAIFIRKIEEARKGDTNPQTVKTMQEVEREILDKATELELIDPIAKRELERLREDRHLCAHPSLRSLGEFYEPRIEYARAHLAVALEALLTHPPIQGQKAMDRFRKHVIDPSFTESPGYLIHAFFNSVRSATRRQIVALAVKHAMLELSVPEAIDAMTLAKRMAICVEIFAERDREMLRDLIRNNVERLRGESGGVQIRTLGRLGGIDVFWESVDEPTRSRFEDLVRDMPLPGQGKFDENYATVLSLVAVDEIRSRIPTLQDRFTQLAVEDQADVIARRPSRYFASFVPKLLEKASSYQSAMFITEQAVIPCGRFLTMEQLNEALTHWANNTQCWYARKMPELAVKLHVSTAHLRPRDKQIWQQFIEAVRRHEEADGWYHYTELEEVVGP